MIDIRVATARDGPFVLSLAPRFAPPQLPPWRTADAIASGTARHLARALANQNDRSTILIAQEGGEPLGFAWIFIEEDFFSGSDVLKISEIAVLHDGVGAGAALMAASEAWGRRKGCSMATLNVLEGNPHARAFYERGGYRPEFARMVKRLEGAS